MSFCVCARAPPYPPGPCAHTRPPGLCVRARAHTESGEGKKLAAARAKNGGRREARRGHRPTAHSDQPTDRPALRSAGPKVREIWPIAAHRWATPPAAVRISAATDRQTDERTDAQVCQRCAQVGQSWAFAAHRWANFSPSLRTSGTHLPQRCAQPQRPTDAHKAASAGQRWAKGARHLAHRCAQVGHTSPSDAHNRPTDRRTTTPATLDMRSTITNRTDVSI
jgi:hypothetical protein